MARQSSTLQQHGTARATIVEMFVENGPFKIADDLTLDDNPYGWDVSHNLIYVDQPIGTGYSYSTDPADTIYGQKGKHTCRSSRVMLYALFQGCFALLVLDLRNGRRLGRTRPRSRTSRRNNAFS